MKFTSVLPYAPAALFGVGFALLVSTGRQSAVPLVRPIAPEVPAVIDSFTSYDQTISPEERRVAGMSDYLLRIYSDRDSSIAFSVYVGYYESQTQGSSIHSPKNCLPGAGWEPLHSGTKVVRAEGQPYEVNRYLLANGPVKAVVYYWYQGRGRIAASEYAVKWELLRDKALLGRSEETLVRIVVPVGRDGSEERADSLATRVAAETIPAVFRAIPTLEGH